MPEIIYTLIVTHITILCVTLYLHRGQAHRGIEFHPVISHFMRFWLWLTTGMVTKEWVAIHRKHHQNTDKEGDPHSPHIYGITQVLLGGAFLYKDAANDEEMIKKYGIGTPDDWLENNIYTPFNWFGIFLMLAINLYLFGLFGLIIWLVQMLWIPFWAAGVINGIGHFLGYRNHDTKDKSRNILPIGLIVGGEELHNNHHNAPASAKLSNKWYEFDIGWFWLRVLHNLKLAKIKDYQ